jgi:hypothetical protein
MPPPNAVAASLAVPPSCPWTSGKVTSLRPGPGLGSGFIVGSPKLSCTRPCLCTGHGRPEKYLEESRTVRRAQLPEPCPPHVPPQTTDLCSGELEGWRSSGREEAGLAGSS